MHKCFQVTHGKWLTVRLSVFKPEDFGRVDRRKRRVEMKIKFVFALRLAVNLPAMLSGIAVKELSLKTGAVITDDIHAILRQLCREIAFAADFRSVFAAEHGDGKIDFPLKSLAVNGGAVYFQFCRTVR